MDPSLYNALLKCDVDVYRQFKEKISEQVTGNQNTVLHVIAQHHDCPGCVGVILSDQGSEVVECLLTWKNSQGDTALCIAARNNHIGMVKLLIGRVQLIIQRAQLLDIGKGSGTIVAYDMLRMSNKNGDTALHEAVNHKCKEIVKLLVEADPDFEHLPNKMMYTPLYLAMERRYHLDEEVRKTFDDILESIISTCTAPGYGGPCGETVLHATTRCSGYFTSGYSKWIERIHKKNSKIIEQVDDRGFTPLHHVAWWSMNADLAEELLKIDKNMAYVRASDKHDRMTALHITFRQSSSTSFSSTTIMETILKHCPDCWDMTTSKGRNILHLAAENQDQYVIDFILKQPWAMNLINQVDHLGNTPLPQPFPRPRPVFETPPISESDIEVFGVEGLNGKPL